LKILIPLHVSGIWVPYYASSLLETGSIGVGLNLSLYMEAYTIRGTCKIIFNNREVFNDLAEIICSETGLNTETKIISPIDLGHGYGVSAGILIAHTLGSYIIANKPSLKALQKAHVLEVENKTGLGDVIAEYTGGLVVRVKPGAPGVGYAYRVIPREKPHLIVTSLSRQESTPLMLSRMSKEICSLGEKLLEKFIETEDISMFFEYSRYFTSRLFSYGQLSDLLSGLRGVIGYYLKKSALIIWIEEEYINDITETLTNRGFKTHYATISHTGVTVEYTS
jgi:Predicted archaeal kinase (sugar kinase superfamily)